MKKQSVHQKHISLAFSVALLSFLGISMAGTRPAMADGWTFSTFGEQRWVPGDGLFLPTGTTAGIMMGSAQASSDQSGLSSASASASASGTCVSNSLPGTNVSAAGSLGTTIHGIAVWSPSGGVPTQSYTATSSTLLLATCSAAAAKDGDPQTGQIIYMGTAVANTGNNEGNFPGDSTLGLPAYLQADSPTADPAGLALTVGPFRLQSQEGFDPGPGSSVTGVSDHSRNGVYIYQNGSLAWGENIDTGLRQYTETDKFSASYFQSNPNQTYMSFHYGGGTHLTASATSRPKTATDSPVSGAIADAFAATTVSFSTP